MTSGEETHWAPDSTTGDQEGPGREVWGGPGAEPSGQVGSREGPRAPSPAWRTKGGRLSPSKRRGSREMQPRAWREKAQKPPNT